MSEGEMGRDKATVGGYYPGLRCRQIVARAAGLAGTLLLVSMCAWANTDQVFVQTYPLAKGGHFTLDNINGSVQVEGWDRDEVEVRAVKTAAAANGEDVDAVQIEVDSQPSKIAVHTHYPGGPGADVGVEYHIHVPNRVLLGKVGTVNGSVRVRGVDGGGELSSVNGDVEVTDSSGRFNAKTTNGDLHLELRHLQNGEPMDLETVNGSVSLGLPSDARADIEGQNMNGDFYSEVPVTPVTLAGALPGSRAFHGRFGRGGGPISVRTVNGGIRLFVEHGGV